MVSNISSGTEEVTWSDNDRPLNCQPHPHLPACLLGGQIIAADALARRRHSGEEGCTAGRPHPKSSKMKPFRITGKNASKLFRPPGVFRESKLAQFSRRAHFPLGSAAASWARREF